MEFIYYDYDDADPLILGLYLAQAGWIEKGIRNCPGSIYWFKKALNGRIGKRYSRLHGNLLKRYTAGMDATSSCHSVYKAEGIK